MMKKVIAVMFVAVLAFGNLNAAEKALDTLKASIAPEAVSQNLPEVSPAGIKGTASHGGEIVSRDIVRLSREVADKIKRVKTSLTREDHRYITDLLRSLERVLEDYEGEGQDDYNLICEPRGGGDLFSVYSLKTKESIGSVVQGLDVCKAIVSSSKNGFICYPRGPNMFSLYSLETEETIGSVVQGLDVCISLIPQK